MSYNGSGTFNINTAGQPVVTGTVISSTAFNALTADLGTGLSTAITKDGQTVATARIPFAAGINSSLVTDATNTTTGSIITAGGVGIAKALFVGTTANIAGTTTLAGVTATSITDSGLTSGRVTFASTSGLLADAAALAWDGTSLSATKFAGALNGTVGATTPAAGAFTTLSASGTAEVGIITSVSNKALINLRTADTSTAGAFASSGLNVWNPTTVGTYSQITFGYNSIALTYAAAYFGLVSTNTTGGGYGDLVFGVRAVGTDTQATERARISSTGLAVTGTLSATGTVVVGPSVGMAVIRRNSVSGSNGITIQGNANDTVSDTNPGASINISGGPLTDTYEGNIELTAYGDTAGVTRNNITFRNRSGANTVTERARIDSSGNLLVGTTSALFGARFTSETSGFSAAGLITNTASEYGAVAWNTATAGDNGFFLFGTEGTYTTRGSITYNRAGGLVAYNVTSDYRAKDISGPITGSGALIDSTPVYMGKMKDATQERPMFIAHEVPAYAHTGEKDAVDADGNPVYQQMDASALIPVMWAELQSLRLRVAQLEAK